MRLCVTIRLNLKKKVTRILRISLYNTFQPNYSNANESTWMLRMQGDILHPKNMKKLRRNGSPFEKLLSRVSIDLPLESLTYESESEKKEKAKIVWNNPNYPFHAKEEEKGKEKEKEKRSEGRIDGIEVTRKGRKNCMANIKVYPLFLSFA